MNRKSKKITNMKFSGKRAAGVYLGQPALKKLQSGQSIVEFFAAMLVLIPLFWGIITLGKLFDFDNASRQALRYLNWEQTAYTPANYDPASANIQVRDLFFRAQLGGFDSNITNQPEVNPLWSMPALTRPAGSYYIISPDDPIQVTTRTMNADPLVSDASPASQHNQATRIQSVSLNIPLDSMPWELSNYPENEAIRQTSTQQQVAQYTAAILPDTFIPASEEDMRDLMPNAQTISEADLALATQPVFTVIVAVGAAFNWLGVPFSYPFAEVWDYPWQSFFDTHPDSAVIPPSRLEQ